MMTHIAGSSGWNTSSIRPDWDWVESAVWTDRMLNALLHGGVRGGRWHNLIDKVYARRNLDRAYQRVAAKDGAGGVDHVTVDRYRRKLEHNQEHLANALHSGDYHPLPVLRTWVPKPGSSEKRPLGIPCLRDRIAQRALKNVIEPIFEATFHPCSHGFRPGMGCKDALREVEELVRSGHAFVVDADIRGFFDNIPKDRLMQFVSEQIADGRVLSLIDQYLHQGVVEGMREWEPEKGTPQGAVISPLLANIYLNPFDWAMAGHGIRIVRYADDFVMLCPDRAHAERALALADSWMRDNELELHPTKTRLVNMDEDGAEFTFLGYRFKRHTSKRGRRSLLRLVAAKSKCKLHDKLRRLTRRGNGWSLPTIIRRVNRTLRGWYGYYKHCHTGEHAHVDGYVRRRLRCILRKRHKRGRGTGHCHEDHRRWPNSFFREHGCFSLEDARASEVQSPRGTC